jgi:hypothetical protein
MHVTDIYDNSRMKIDDDQLMIDYMTDRFQMK